ncbi:hypothetical protein H6G64_33265 [Calothrix sp. FACHB-156]|nr:hypothetical protein [Calothrix sp. FACHB-156]
MSKEVFAPIIHERCLLMARAEAEAVCQQPDLGEDIYNAWLTMDANQPEDFDLTEWIDELSGKYRINSHQVSALFESIRVIILQYDDLIDSI